MRGGLDQVLQVPDEDMGSFSPSVLNSFSVCEIVKCGMSMQASLPNVKTSQLVVSMPVGIFPICLILEEHCFPTLQKNCSGVVSNVTLFSPVTFKQVG